MKKVIAIFAALLLALALPGCAQSPSSGGSGQGSAAIATLTDSAGYELTLKSTPARVIVLNAADAEILYAIGAGESVIAVGEYCNYPAEAAAKPKIGTGANTNLEEIIALNPDLIIMNKMAQTIEQNDALRAAGINVFISAPLTVEETLEMIGLLGAVMSKTQEAQKIVKDMRDQFLALEALTKGIVKKSAYVEISPLPSLWTCGAGTFQDELLAIAGIENVFADVGGWDMVSEEQVLSRDPDFILTTGNFPSPEECVAEIHSRESWQGMTAVKSGQVLAIDPDMTSRPGPRLALAAQNLYQAVYGGQ